MRMSSVLIVLFIVVLLLALLNIEPYQSGHFVMPSPISLEASLFLVIISLVIIVFLILRKKGYTPIMDKIKEKYDI